MKIEINTFEPVTVLDYREDAFDEALECLDEVLTKEKETQQSHVNHGDR